MANRRASEDSIKRRQFWEHHVAGWEESGLPQVAYCREHGISIKSFGYWKRKLRGGDATPCLVELPVVQEQGVVIGCGQALRLEVGRHFRIEIDKGFDPATLEAVLRVLERL